MLRRVRAPGFRLVTAGLAVALAACGHRSTPTEPPPMPPALQCPADLAAESLDGNSAVVSYTSPTASGGTPPYTISCTPPSGSAFAIGTTAVKCSVADAASQDATCSFSVRVGSPPKLSMTRFLAFGDSLTYGTTSASPTLLLNDIADSYPTKLQELLRSRYRTQTPVVLNDGVGGERIVGATLHSPGAMLRLPQSIVANPSEVLLLMEGTNDILNSGENGVAPAIDGLRRMIEYAKSHGMQQVFLATLPPIRAGGARHRDAAAAIVPGYNDQVRALASSAGVPLVDVYGALVDQMNLIGVDDLHPTPHGYDVIAATFRDAINANLEEPRALRAH